MQLEIAGSTERIVRDRRVKSGVRQGIGYSPRHRGRREPRHGMEREWRDVGPFRARRECWPATVASELAIQIEGKGTYLGVADGWKRDTCRDGHQASKDARRILGRFNFHSAWR